MSLSIDCYRQGDYAVPMVSAARDCPAFQRNKHAEKCLPLSIANTAGWWFLCPEGVTITWNGGPEASDLTVVFDGDGQSGDREGRFAWAKSHFKTGYVTFETGWLLKTSANWQIWAKGPPNHIKDGVAPLEGIVESEWLDYSFTMNWAMTRPGQVRFEKGEPFCFITAVQLQPIIDCQPVRHLLTDNPELMMNVSAGTREREAFLKRMDGDASARKRGWMGRYMRGEQPEGSTAPRPQNHHHKIRTKAPCEPPSHAAPKVPALPVQRMRAFDRLNWGDGADLQHLGTALNLTSPAAVELPVEA